MAEEGGALRFPRPGHAEDGDRARRFEARLEAALDDAPRDEVGARVVDHVHDDGDALDGGLLQQQAGEGGDLAHAGIAADLAVVGGAAPVRADGVEGGEAGPAPADQERERAIKADDAPGHAAVVGAVDARRLQLEVADLAVGAGGGIDAEFAQRLALAVEGVVVDFGAGVEGDPAAIGGAGERVDLGEQQVAFAEEPPEAGEDGGQLDQLAPGEAEGGDGFLQPEVLGGVEGGEGDAGGRGRFRLDVDAAGEGGDGGGAARAVVVDDAEVALGLDRQRLLDEQAADGLAGDARGEDGAGRFPGGGGAFGEAHGPGFGASAGAHLPLDGDAGPEFGGGERRLRGGGGEAPARRLKAGAPEERLGLVLEEAHGGRAPG